jgi:hypothetical protein
MVFNGQRQYCYRICHIENLEHILQYGLCTQHHKNANPNYKPIGNPDIIGNRDRAYVKIQGYGVIGDYIPFYFTPRSIMLYNIVTGYRAPFVPKLPRQDIIIFRALIADLCEQEHRYFFTDGQANTTSLTNHFNALTYLDRIDWESILSGNFTKSGDPDRPRRYQAEILVQHHLPITSLSSIIVYNKAAEAAVKSALNKAGIILNVQVISEAFF